MKGIALKKILSSDGDHMRLKEFTTLLESENHATSTAMDGESSLRKFRELQPNALLLYV